jgi:hypothetical protein
MNKQRNIDWTVVFGLAARAGSRELVRALRTAMEHECTAAIEQFDATLARQRAECDAALARQRATCDEILAQQHAEFEQRYAALLTMIDNELGPVIKALRQELAAANAELARLRAARPAD